MLEEIPGGCMCCVNGLPMQLGLNMLLQAKPDRLLIEPTELGHPKQILALLTQDSYASWIDLQANHCIETRQVAPLSSRIELIHCENADWNALQSGLFKI